MAAAALAAAMVRSDTLMVVPGDVDTTDDILYIYVCVCGGGGGEWRVKVRRVRYGEVRHIDGGAW